MLQEQTNNEFCIYNFKICSFLQIKTHLLCIYQNLVSSKINKQNLTSMFQPKTARIEQLSNDKEQDKESCQKERKDAAVQIKPISKRKRIKRVLTKKEIKSKNFQISSQTKAMVIYGQKIPQKRNRQPQLLLENYQSAVKNIQQPVSYKQKQRQIMAISQFLSKIQCHICLNRFNLKNKRPMIVCQKWKTHRICSQCYIKQNKSNISLKCSMCRVSINKDETYDDRDLMNWIQLSQKLGLETPKQIVELPEQFRHCLRKISIHEFNKLQRAQMTLIKRENQQNTLKMKTIYRNLVALANQKQLQLKELQNKLKEAQRIQDQNIKAKQLQLQGINRQIQEANISKDIIKKQLEIARYEIDPKIMFSFQKDKSKLKYYTQARQTIKPIFLSLQNLFYQYPSALGKEFEKHESEVHNNESLYKICYDQFYKTNSNGRFFPYVSIPTDKNNYCAYCDKTFNQKKSAIFALDQKRSRLVYELQRAVNSNFYEVVNAFLTFTPENLQQYIQKQSQIIDCEQQNIIENIRINEFSHVDRESFMEMLLIDDQSGMQKEKKKEIQVLIIEE